MPESVKDLQLLFEKDKAKIYAYINKIDDKHTEHYNDIKLLLNTFIESQKPLNKGIEDMTKEIKTLNGNILDITSRVKGIEEKVESHDEYITKRQQANKDIVRYFIRILFGTGGIAYLIVENFFK